MKRVGVILIVGLLSLMMLGRPAAVAAQETPELAGLSIALWPEFDRPDMLVIYQGSLAPDTPLPAAVEIRIPASVGRPTAVAFVSEAGERLNQEYTTRVEGELLVVSFTLASMAFQLEYYDTLTVPAEGQREYAFSYTADYAIDDLAVELQMPPTADDLEVEPEAGAAGTRSDGLVYHVIDVGAVEPGETVAWTFRYAKDDEQLTNPAQPSQGTTPAVVPGQTGGGDSGGDSAVITFVVAFVALLSVGGAAFWLGRNTKPGGAEASRAVSRPASSSRRLITDVAFCHKCGAELRSDAEFCHKCGAPVRS